MEIIKERVDKYNEEHDPELKRYLFGHSITENKIGEKKEKSVFETILSTPGSKVLIKAIWEKFDLYSRPEILTHVSLSHFRFLLY